TYDISAPILGTLHNLSSIVHLDLSNNNIVEEIPKSLSNLCNLITLDLQSNNFFGDVSELLERFCECESPKLELLAFRGNYLDGRPLEKLGRLKNLGSMDLAYNKLNGTIPDSVGSLSRLKMLQMNLNQLTGSIPDTIGGLSSLYFIDLSYNNLNGSLPESIGRLGELETLIVHHNLLTGIVTENHFANLTSLKNLWIGDNKLVFKLNVNSLDLDFLDLSSNNLSGSLEPFLCSGIQEPRKLRVLNLANNNMSGVISDCWMNWEFLFILNVEKTNFLLSGNLPISLLNSKSLMIIRLAENELVGRIPASIERDNTSLKLLSLRSNNLEGTCRHALQTSQSFLDNIVLGRASLVTKGRVSTYDNILYLVTTLDLSTNKFSGSIPDELVSLLGLRYLNLSHNNLTGRIPNLFSKSGILESLDLSVNHLDGNFPSSLSGLTTLNFLNVSYNNLVGRIPTGSQLQTLNESSFIGNALCDYPLPACSQNNGNPGGTKDKHDESNGIDLILMICTLIGLIIGFWIIISPLIVSEPWRNTYYHFLEDIWIKLHKVILIMFPCFRRREPRNEILFSNDQVQKFDLSQYIYGEPQRFWGVAPLTHAY
ncbi:hypothetical protein R6Q57_021388, partial [Mikania cordata]